MPGTQSALLLRFYYKGSPELPEEAVFNLVSCGLRGGRMERPPSPPPHRRVFAGFKFFVTAPEAAMLML